MTDCVFCRNPLVCETCGANYVPDGPEAYEALMRPELPVACPVCEAIVVCHWCKTPYDGSSDSPDEGE